ncbi:hypothetical protein [Legionella yabuuchiae]|uniref:hypothetical protein n=1 Tax=Legionella yabuuchiae TaxID=376727 RepID=UPI0010552287|nr:hypothetical protein [Legionella yabuuchiae]
MSTSNVTNSSFLRLVISAFQSIRSFFGNITSKIFKRNQPNDTSKKNGEAEKNASSTSYIIAQQRLKNKKPPVETDRESLLLEIQQFDKLKLRKQTVYYVSSSLGRYVLKPKTHGFAVIGTKATAEKAGFGEPYYLGASIMHARFKLTKTIVKNVTSSKKISSSTKKAIELMKRQEYSSVEHFLRALLTQKARLAGMNLKSKHVRRTILQQATNPNGELRCIVAMNSLVNGRKGAVLPKNSKCSGRTRDRTLFEKGSSLQNSKAYPNIEPDILRDVFQQQLIYSRYMDELAGIGKATDPKLKERQKDASETTGIIDNFIEYKLLPEKDDVFSSNCNKATANLLQLAEDRSAKKQGRNPQKITGASIWAIGAKQHLFLWDPLKQNLNAIVHQLIEHNKIDSAQISLQELANNKRGILHIISNLPKNKKIKALQCIFNDETILNDPAPQKRTLY